MNEKQTDELISRFPLACSELKYFECGSGWFSIIALALHEIDRAIKGLKTPEDYYVVQIKEKLGGLRIYMSANFDENGNRIDAFDEIIERAEDAAINICETCGKPGKLVNDHGWYYTACPDHVKESKTHE